MQTKTIDWFFIINDLQRAGLHPALLAQRIGVSRMAVQGWKIINSEPRHCDGEKLLEIWRTITGKSTPPTKIKMTGKRQ